MEQDLSNRTVTVLVVLTVLISVLGSLSVLNAVNEVKLEHSGAKAIEKGHKEGKVSLVITEPRVPGAASATGMISFEIKPAEENLPLLQS